MSEAPERISVESDEFTLDTTQSKVNIGPIKDPIYIGEEARMSEAPERIWVCPEDETWQSGHWDLGPDGQGLEAEYLRADLAQASVAAALTKAADRVYGYFNRKDILALITPDAKAALDWVVAQRIKELKGQNND